jgi:hypothetical protein
LFVCGNVLLLFLTFSAPKKLKIIHTTVNAMKKVGFKGTEPCVAKNKEEKMRNIARRKKQRGGGLLLCETAVLEHGTLFLLFRRTWLFVGLFPQSKERQTSWRHYCAREWT